MKVVNEVYLEFQSKSFNESFSRTVVASLVSQLDPTISEIADVKTAVSEAVTNAIIHGYDNEEGKISIKCVLFDEAVEIVIRDEGKGIDNIHVAMQPLFTSKPYLDRSGMGFTIMENFMDNIEVYSEKNRGTTVKLFKKFESVTEKDKALVLEH